MDAIVDVFGWYVLVDGEEEEGAGVRRWMNVKERAASYTWCGGSSGQVYK